MYSKNNEAIVNRWLIKFAFDFDRLLELIIIKYCQYVVEVAKVQMESLRTHDCSYIKFIHDVSLHAVHAIKLLLRRTDICESILLKPSKYMRIVSIQTNTFVIT